MKTASLIPAALVLGLAGPALAGGFVGLGLGSPSKIDDASGRFAADGRSVHLFGGYAYPIATGRIAAEAGYMGYDLTRQGLAFSGRVLSLAGRYNHKISDGFEVFGRLGIQQTSLDDAGGVYNMSGAGPVIGAGFEYHPALKRPVDAAVYVDMNYYSATLDTQDSRGQTLTNDVSDHLFSLGVVVGF